MLLQRKIVLLTGRQLMKLVVHRSRCFFVFIPDISEYCENRISYGDQNHTWKNETTHKAVRYVRKMCYVSWRSIWFQIEKGEHEEGHDFKFIVPKGQRTFLDFLSFPGQ